MPQCRHCKAQNESDAAYCDNCGSLLTTGSESKVKRNFFINASIVLLALFVIMYILTIIGDVLENSGIEIISMAIAQLGLEIGAIILLLRSNRMGAFLAIIVIVLDFIAALREFIKPSDTQHLVLLDFFLCFLTLACIAGGWKSLE